MAGRSHREYVREICHLGPAENSTRFAGRPVQKRRPEVESLCNISLSVLANLILTSEDLKLTLNRRCSDNMTSERNEALHTLHPHVVCLVLRGCKERDTVVV